MTDSARPRAGVQSIERAFALLEILAEGGGVMGLSQLAQTSGLPLPTIHRLLRTLVGLGYLRQETNRRYALGPRLIWLGETSSRMLDLWARPHLADLAGELGESANLAMLDDDAIVYVAQVQSSQSMRMFTEVGRRVLPHCTAVGKAIMAEMSWEEVRAILQRTGMPRHTETTLTQIDDFAAELTAVAERSYALDEGEQENGVRCVAVVVADAPARMALSISGPSGRVTDELIAQAVPQLQKAAQALSRDLA